MRPFLIVGSAVALLFVAVFFGHLVHWGTDPGGWASAKWGMSVEQVRASMPGSLMLPASAEQQVCPDYGTKGSGVLGLVASGVRLAGSVWTVCFFFEPSGKHGLVAVRLLSEVAPLAACVHLQTTFVDAFGGPYVVGNNSNDPTVDRPLVWMYPSSLVAVHRVLISPEEMVGRVILIYTRTGV